VFFFDGIDRNIVVPSVCMANEVKVNFSCGRDIFKKLSDQASAIDSVNTVV